MSSIWLSSSEPTKLGTEQLEGTSRATPWGRHPSDSGGRMSNRKARLKGTMDTHWAAGEPSFPWDAIS